MAPKIIGDVPEDTPAWVHIPGFDVPLPTSIEPGSPLDRIGVYVEVSRLFPHLSFKMKPIYDKHEGRKVESGRFYRSDVRWVYESEVIPGSPDIRGHEAAPAQLTLLEESDVTTDEAEEGVA